MGGRFLTFTGRKKGKEERRRRKKKAFKRSGVQAPVWPVFPSPPPSLKKKKKEEKMAPTMKEHLEIFNSIEIFH